MDAWYIDDVSVGGWDTGTSVSYISDSTSNLWVVETREPVIYPLIPSRDPNVGGPVHRIVPEC
jgi:hypothetical protein